MGASITSSEWIFGTLPQEAVAISLAAREVRQFVRSDGLILNDRAHSHSRQRSLSNPRIGICVLVVLLRRTIRYCLLVQLNHLSVRLNDSGMKLRLVLIPRLPVSPYLCPILYARLIFNPVQDPVRIGQSSRSIESVAVSLEKYRRFHELFRRNL